MTFFGTVLWLLFAVAVYFAARYVSRLVLSCFFDVDGQNGVFSFCRLIYRANGLEIEFGNVSMSFNILSLFTTSAHLFWLQTESLRVRLIPKAGGAAAKEEKASEKPDLVHNSVLLALLHTLVHKVAVYLDVVTVEIPEVRTSVTAKDLHFVYTRFSGSLFEFGYSLVSVNQEKLGSFVLKAAEYSVRVDENSILKMINLTRSLDLLNVYINNFCVSTTNYTLTIAPFSIMTELYPGLVEIKIPEVLLELPDKMAFAKMQVDKIAVDITYPLYNIPHLQTENLVIDILGFKISSITENLITVNHFNITTKDMKVGNPVYLLDEICLNYSSLDGLELFPLIKQFRGEAEDPPSRPVFELPDLNFMINSIKANLYFTDKAQMSASSGNVTFKNGVFSFPRVLCALNDIPMAKATQLEIFSKDKSYLDVKLDKFVFHHRNKVDVAEFIDHATYAWSLVKVYVSRGIFDSETLPFPLRLQAACILFKFDDTLANASLQYIVKRIPEFMKESLLLKYIMNLKIEQCHLTDSQEKLAHEKLGKHIFNKYKDAIKQMKIDKKLVMSITKAKAEFDSRNFTGMVGKIHQFDPAIKEFNPDCGWETLEGFDANISFSTCDIKCFDLPEPLISATSVSMKGPIVFGEVKAPQSVPVTFSLGKKEYSIMKSPGDIKLYCDMNFRVLSASLYYGTALSKVYDDFADVFGTLIPDGPDPSPPLKWWDKIRSMFRGNFNFEINRFILELLGSSDPYSISNKLTCILTNSKLSFTEGILSLQADSLQGVRCDGGPVLVHLPKIIINVTFIWQTQNQDQRNHLMIPDPAKFSDPNYDTYLPFRAMGFDIDLDFNFQNDDFIPFISLDYAHLEWLISPIWLFVNDPPLDRCYKHKFGMPIKRPAPYPTLSSLNWIVTYRFNVPQLALRFFDHFPSFEATAINGTSVDMTLLNPNFSCRTEFPVGGEDVYDIGLAANTIQINLSDLADYAKTTTIFSSTFAEIKDFDARYGTSSKVTVSIIKVYLNQIFSMYINEFVRSIIHIMNKKAAEHEQEEKKEKAQQKSKTEEKKKDDHKKAEEMKKAAKSTDEGKDLLSHLMRRRSSQRFASVIGQDTSVRKSVHLENLNQYNNLIFSANVPLIQIVVESMNYEANLYSIIKGANFSFKSSPVTGLYAAEANLNSASFYHNAGFHVITEDLPTTIASIDTIKLLFNQQLAFDYSHENYLDIQIDQVTSTVNTNQIAMIKQLVGEVLPDSPTNEKQLAIAAEDYYALKIAIVLSQCQIDLRDQFSVEMCVAIISKTTCNINWTLKGNTENTFTFENVFINDIRKDARFSGVVLMRWMDMTSSDSPHLRIQMNTSPPVGGITIMTHVEVNIDPTTFNYDADFADVIETMLTSKIIAPKTGNVRNYIKSEYVSPLPPVLIPEHVLPKIGESWRDFFVAIKSSEINVMVERAETNFLIRYFKVTDAKMNVSYKNEENTIISEINEFNGELHDIIYQDLTTNFGGLASKLIGTVTRDMIPQFLKHFIGLGKISPAKESDLQQWLSIDQNKAMSKKKQLIFGKGQK